MRIRKYLKQDREEIEKIHFKLGFFGSTMSNVLSSNKFWKKNISYYLDEEPENVFVVEHENKVKGYLLGSLNKDVNIHKIILINNIKNFFLNLFRKKEDRVFWTRRLFVLIDILLGKSGEIKLKIPKNSGHFHINILPELQGKKLGEQLIKCFEKHAKRRGVKKIHAILYESFDYKVYKFFSKQGFNVFSKVKTNSWKKYFPKKDIKLAVYTKEL